MIIIGYSGHAYVAIGILRAAGVEVDAYCDFEEKQNNPFKLKFLGREASQAAQDELRKRNFFIAVGDNRVRSRVFQEMERVQLCPLNAIHPKAMIDRDTEISPKGVMISAGVCINPLVKIGKAVICNTGCIIEHECSIGDFAHIGPGAILCGNVTVGTGSYVGAGAVVRQGIRIGSNCMIGAGAVVIRNIEDNQTVIGNPSREMALRS